MEQVKKFRHFLQTHPIPKHNAVIVSLFVLALSLPLVLGAAFTQEVTSNHAAEPTVTPGNPFATSQIYMRLTTGWNTITLPLIPAGNQLDQVIKASDLANTIQVLPPVSPTPSIYPSVTPPGNLCSRTCNTDADCATSGDTCNRCDTSTHTCSSNSGTPTPPLSNPPTGPTTPTPTRFISQPPTTLTPSPYVSNSPNAAQNSSSMTPPPISMTPPVKPPTPVKEIVLYYHGHEQIYIPGHSPDFSIPFGLGIAILVNSDSAYVDSGNIPTNADAPIVPINAGWTLIGVPYPGKDQLTARDVLISLLDSGLKPKEIDDVVGFGPTNYTSKKSLFIDANGKISGEDFLISKTKGYWVNTDKTGSWSEAPLFNGVIGTSPTPTPPISILPTKQLSSPPTPPLTKVPTVPATPTPHP